LPRVASKFKWELLCAWGSGVWGGTHNGWQIGAMHLSVRGERRVQKDGEEAFQEEVRRGEKRI
jgi:hypothetical protein